jgi:hypothetical protein
MKIYNCIFCLGPLNFVIYFELCGTNPWANARCDECCTRHCSYHDDFHTFFTTYLATS